jgi:hypothetical protein
MAVTFDRSPQKVSFKMMAGATLLQEFIFFDHSNPETPNVTLDIRNLNFRMTGRLLGNNIALEDSVFDANILFGSTGNRNGLWLSQGTENKLIFFHDWVSDTAAIENAPEGIFQFKLWVTGSYGDDTCIAVLEYDLKKINVIDDTETQIDGEIHVFWTIQTTTIPVNVKLIK